MPETEPFYRSYDRMTPGEVAEITPTGTEILGDTVMAVDARYVDHRGVSRTVRSYTDGVTPSIGETVAVLFDRDDPDDVVIAGMRSGPAPWFVSFFLLPFLGSGLWFALGRLGMARRQIRLLERGRLATGTRVAHDQDGVELNDRRETIITYEFTTGDGHIQRCDAHTTRPDELLAGTTAPLLYDPGWPDHATLLRHLPARPEITADDTLVHRANLMKATLACLPPLACVGLVIATAVLTAASWT